MDGPASRRKFVLVIVFLGASRWPPQIVIRYPALAMPRNSDQILADIDAFRPSNGNWLPLDALIAELWSVGVTERAILRLFDVFERFPKDDGAGVLWSILHGVEHLDFDYGDSLRASIARQPSLMGGIISDGLSGPGGITSRCCGRARVAWLLCFLIQTFLGASRWPPQIVIRYAAQVLSLSMAVGHWHSAL